jgi:exoribonuclease-2
LIKPNGLTGETVTGINTDRPRLEVLERLALFGDESSQRAQAVEILAALKDCPDSRGCIRYTSNIGPVVNPRKPGAAAQPNTGHIFLRTLAMAQQRLSSPPPDPDQNRLDLTHLKVYTVDDASTLEIDDGLSLETLEDGRQRIWVHIADPTRWFTPGDALDLEARRRCTTVYLPTGIIPMFPAELATGVMSLVQGQTCCALSFGIVLTEAGDIEDYTIHPT